MPATKRNGSTKWSARHYVTVYAMARDGHTRDAIARAIGVDPKTLGKWMRDRPALRDAWERGRAHVDGSAPARPDIEGYVYQQLSPEMARLWDQITEAEHLDNTRERVEALFARHGKHARQAMFIHALVNGLHNPTRAMQRTGVTKRMLDHWVDTDPGFATLLDEIQWHKQNWYIGYFDMLVASGSESATLHAVKTVCADRGYVDRVRVKHEGDVVNPNLAPQLDLTELDLDPDTLAKVLEALRKREIAMQSAGAPDALPDPMMVEGRVVS